MTPSNSRRDSRSDSKIPKGKERASQLPLRRRMSIEPLEDRRMLAPLVVTNANNSGAGSLRDAIAMANAMPGADVIHFAEALTGQTIALEGQELQISEELTIDATALAEKVMIAANQASRILNITAISGDFTIAGLALTGGKTVGDNADNADNTHSGGAIRSLSAGALAIDRSVISDNSTEGDYAHGGGIFALGDVTLSDSAVSDNNTAGLNAVGGGIVATGNLTLVQTTVSGNSTSGWTARGGGIWAYGNATLTESSVSDNRTEGEYASGGGIWANGAATLTDSSVSENSTEGKFANGGGVFTLGNVTLSDTAVSGNSTAGSDSVGGAIATVGIVSLGQSTVSDNSTAGDRAPGGGIFANGNVSLNQTTVSGNRTTGSGADGGGIAANGIVSLVQSTVSGNHTSGSFGRGGGIWAYDAVTLTESSVSGNSTSGSNGRGGGIWTGAATLSKSSVSDNSTQGEFARGGGIFANDDVILTESAVTGNSTAGLRAVGGGILANGVFSSVRSTISGNSTAGANAIGGGIWANRNLILAESTVSGNTTVGSQAHGGGLYALNDITVVQSTVSGNSTAGDLANGAGIWAGYIDLIRQSTISGNHAMHSATRGGGVYQYDSNRNVPAAIINSIIAGNTAGVGGPDLFADPGAAPLVLFALIGDAAGSGITAQADAGILIDVDPLLGPLANYGGPMLTHTLLPGSPAINSGDPDAVQGVDGIPEFDQRGTPFGRVADGRIDIGAVEYDALLALPGDYDDDADVDGADFLAWQRGLGEQVAPYADADGNGNGVIDQPDLQIWRSNFGATFPDSAASAANTAEIELAADFTNGIDAATLGSLALLGDPVPTPSVNPLASRFALWSHAAEHVVRPREAAGPMVASEHVEHIDYQLAIDHVFDDSLGAAIDATLLDAKFCSEPVELELAATLAALNLR